MCLLQNGKMCPLANTPIYQCPGTEMTRSKKNPQPFLFLCSDLLSVFGWMLQGWKKTKGKMYENATFSEAGAELSIPS